MQPGVSTMLPAAARAARARAGRESARLRALVERNGGLRQRPVLPFGSPEGLDTVDPAPVAGFGVFAPPEDRLVPMHEFRPFHVIPDQAAHQGA